MIKKYDEFVNEEYGAKSIGTMLLGLMSVLPLPSKAQETLPTQNSTLPLKPTYGEVYHAESFEESVDRAWRILDRLRRERNVNDRELINARNLLKQLENDLEEGDTEIIIINDIIRVNKSIKTCLGRYGRYLNENTLKTLERITEDGYFTDIHNVDNEQLLYDYNVLYNEIETMKQDYDIDDLRTEEEKFVNVLMYVGLVTLGLILIMLLIKIVKRFARSVRRGVARIRANRPNDEGWIQEED